MDYEVNKFQTVLDNKLLEDLPKEVRSDLIEAIEGIKFVRWLISPEEVRGYAKDRPHGPDSKVIVDITKPHILEDMEFFRERAIHHEQFGCYTKLHPNPNPKSEYAEFWREEVRRWKEGLVRPSDGEWITGYHYFYLNYSPIWVNEEVKQDTKNKAKVRGIRKRNFPDVFLGDYLWFHYMHQAREAGAHCKMLKARGIGASFKLGAITPCTMYTDPGLPNFHLASDKTFLEGDKGVFGKVTDVLDWIGDNTPLPKMRLIDKPLEKQIGYKDEYGARKGLKSSVFGISMKDNPDKARGIRGPIIHYEEDGLFPNLENAWNVNLEAVQGGGIVFGQMVALGTGGCLTEGNKIFTSDGDIKNVETLKLNDNVVGFDIDNKKTSLEEITYWQKELYKECIKIETNSGRTVECSLDHPIYASNKSDSSEIRLFDWIEAGKLKEGNLVSVAEKIDLFQNKDVWNPRLLGILIGDGSYGEKQSPNVTTCDPEIKNYILNNFDSKVYYQREMSTGEYYYNIGIKKIREELRSLGIYGQTGINKRLPKDIFRGSKKAVCELIGGLIDTDGYVGIRRNDKRGKPIAVITLTSSSKDLLLDVQLLLQKLGIHGNIKFVKPNLNKPGKIKDVNGWYNLNIADRDSLVNFYENITLLIKYKQDSLNLIGETYKDIKPLRKNRGFKYEKIVKMENTGIKRVYNFTANTTHTYLANGIITHNTEGADFAGSEKLFYYPDTYNIYGIPNVFDKNVNSENKCGFFWGAYLNRARYYNKSNGEPDVIGALIEIFKERYKIKYSSSDPNAITQKKAELPITPQESIMRRDGTIFPISDLKDYLSEVMPNFKSFVRPHYVGRLQIMGDGCVEFVDAPQLTPIRDYPLKDTLNREGAVEIFEKPQFNVDKRTESFRYIAGIDPIDSDDNITTDSLPSIFILDRYTDRIVAEYTGRPRTANEFFEVCKRLLMYYGATANYENNLKGLFVYFENQHCTHLLCDNPSILDEKGIANTKGNFGNKKKGTTASATINAWGRRLQADWQISPAYGEENEGKLNLHKIRSIGYLKECIGWNPDGNFDRVSAMGMLMIYREEVAKIEIRRVLAKNKTRFEDPWFNKWIGVKKDKEKQFML